MSSIFAVLLLLHFAASSTITTAPKIHFPLLRRQSESSISDGTSCELLLSIESSCVSAIPSFTLLPNFASQARCVCYSSSTWVGNKYDNAFATCLAYLSTASTSYYSYIDGSDMQRAPCSQVSSLVGPGAAAATSSTDIYFEACQSAVSMFSSCEAAIPGSLTLSDSALDQCICYNSGTFVPSTFDHYWSSCLTYFSTASPSYYVSEIGGDAADRSPCAEHAAAASLTSSASTATTTSSPMASSGAGVTSTGASPTSVPLTTTVGTASASGNAAELSFGGLSMVGMLGAGLLATLLHL